MFAALDEMIDDFYWFIPHPDDRGSLRPFFMTHAQVSSDEPSQQRAGYLVKEWGFEKQHDAFFRLMKEVAGRQVFCKCPNFKYNLKFGRK